jgi:hypothetical protein
MDFRAFNGADTKLPPKLQYNIPPLLFSRHHMKFQYVVILVGGHENDCFLFHLVRIVVT